MSSVTCFREFLGPDEQDIDGITGNDLQRFFIELQQRPKFLQHPYLKPRQDRLTSQSIETYAQAKGSRIWLFGIGGGLILTLFLITIWFWAN